MSIFDDMEPAFQGAGEAWNVDPRLLRAVAMQEDPAGDPRAKSKAGALGLMQFMPDTARQIGIEDPFDPVQSIWGAAKYLRQALDAEGGSVPKALLYYHGGPGWRDRFGKESQGYVPGVFDNYRTLQKQQKPDQTTAPASAQEEQN